MCKACTHGLGWLPCPGRPRKVGAKVADNQEKQIKGFPMTTTSLLQPHPQLELLLWSHQLQKVRFNELAALRFVSNAMVSLRDAKVAEFSAIGRYLMTHVEGIYALCLGTLYLYGLLPVNTKTARLTIQLAFEQLDMTVADLHHMLLENRHLEEVAGSAHRKRARRTRARPHRPG